MFCPQCKAEYRRGFTHCSDCDVDLVWELPSEALVKEEPVPPGDPSGDPFCHFWAGDDPRLHAEICEILRKAGIPCRTVRREDHLFNINQQREFQIGVPFSMYQKAEAVVTEAYDPGEPPPSEKDISPFALPESVASSPRREAWDPENWFPEDASVEIWSGPQREMAELLKASLAENRMHSRIALMDGLWKLFVLSEEDLQAREIVRTVVDAVPPE
jgi:hypothetical protein